MLTAVNPKLPMRDKTATRDFYLNKLGFHEFGSTKHDDYLMVEKDRIQIHFFEFRELDPNSNYGQVYIRTNDIDSLYQWLSDNSCKYSSERCITNKAVGTKRIFYP